MAAAGGFGLRHASRLRAMASQLKATALSHISQANAGPAPVRGQISCSETVVSPFTKTPCCCYRVEVDEVTDAGERNSAWSLFHTELSKPVSI